MRGREGAGSPHEREKEFVPPPLGFPLAWLSISRFNLPAVWREWDGEGGSPRV